MWRVCECITSLVVYDTGGVAETDKVLVVGEEKTKKERAAAGENGDLLNKIFYYTPPSPVRCANTYKYNFSH